MIIGITGTREGMTDFQLVEVGRFLANNSGHFHHGDCVGVDVQAARIASHLGYHVVCHPPTAQDMRAFHDSDEVRNPLGYLARDRKIVESVEVLLVVPKQMEWQPKGGTWYTHDYAKRRGVPIIMFWPEQKYA